MNGAGNDSNDNVNMNMNLRVLTLSGAQAAPSARARRGDVRIVIGLAITALAIVGIAAVACSRSDMAPMTAAEASAPPPPPPPPPMDMPAPASTTMGPGGGGGGKRAALAKAKVAAKEAAMDRAEGKAVASAFADAEDEYDGKDKNKKGDKGGRGGLLGGDAAPQSAPRAWFPETFLFAPRVITDAAGGARVDVLVPDRLTTWRVLALAHARNGAQAGTVTSLVGNLPLAVDLVTPPFLVAGDRVALPIQVTNTTDAQQSRPLTTSLTGAGSLSGAPGTIKVDAGATASSSAWLDVRSPGDVDIEARIGSDDAIKKTVPVLSPGMPAKLERSGTLASKRTFTASLESGVLDGSARARLSVYPGALAILRAELAAAPERVSLDDDAYLLSLTGRAKALSTKLGAPVDDAVLLRLQRLASQRIARRALGVDLTSAIRLAPGGLAHPEGTLIRRHGEHMASTVARAQRPDGTWSGGDGWPVQRLLVASADGLAALRAGKGTADGDRRLVAAELRARGAFERFAGQIDDAYTAAVIVAAGGAEEKLLEDLRKKIVEALQTREDGSAALPVPAGAMRADGSTPSEIEATAFAALALAEHAPSAKLLPDLGATLLSAYRPGRGFGDGATNRAALDAIMLVFKDPLPTKVAISFSVDGKVIGSDTLEGARLQEVLALGGALDDEAVRDGKLDVVVEADPPLPGLSYVFGVGYAVPWPKPADDGGLSLDVDLPRSLTVGGNAEIEVRAKAPGGSALKVTQGLPAGVDAVPASLQALVDSGQLVKFEINEGVVVLHAPARRQGELFRARYKVVPTMAGTLQSRVASVELDGAPASAVYFPPTTWTIAR